MKRHAQTTDDLLDAAAQAFAEVLVAQWEQAEQSFKDQPYQPSPPLARSEPAR